MALGDKLAVVMEPDFKKALDGKLNVINGAVDGKPITLNNATAPGCYGMNLPSNSEGLPPEYAGGERKYFYGLLIVERAGDWIWQRLYWTGGGNPMVRRRINQDPWTPWERLATVGDLAGKAAVNVVKMHRTITPEEFNRPYGMSYLATMVPDAAVGPYQDYWAVDYTHFDADDGVQEITAIVSGKKYFRVFYGRTAGAWQRIATDADLSNKANVDGMGYYSGNIDLLREKRESWLCVNASGALPTGFVNWFTLDVIPGGTGSCIHLASQSVGEGQPNQTCIRHHNGEGWDAWTQIPTAADLARKMNISQEIPINLDLNQYTNPGMYFCAYNSVAGTILNTPPGYSGEAFSLLVERHAGIKQTLTLFWTHDLVTLWRNEYAGSWSDWTRVATAETPEEHALPLEAGWTATRKTTYSISQNGLVLVTFGALRQESGVSHATIARLPPSFRPNELISRDGVVTDAIGSRFAAGVDIAPDGSITVYGDRAGWIGAFGQAMFYAVG